MPYIAGIDIEELNLQATPKRLLIALLDGKPHPRKELVKLLPNPDAEPQVLRSHLSHVRKALKPYFLELANVNYGSKARGYKLYRQYTPG